MYASGSANNRGRDNWMALKAIAKSDDTLYAAFKAYNEFKDGKRDSKPVDTVFIVESVAEVATVDNTEAATNDDNAPEPTTPVAMDFTRDAVLSLVNDGKFFGVEFINRTTGEARKMQARIGVTKHLKGGAKKFDDASKNLLIVFSMDANGYRSIPIDAITSLSVKGITYTPATLQQAADSHHTNHSRAASLELAARRQEHMSTQDIGCPSSSSRQLTGQLLDASASTSPTLSVIACKLNCWY